MRSGADSAVAADWRLIGGVVMVLAIGSVGLDPQTDAFWTAREGIDVLNGSPFVHADAWSWAPLTRDYIPNSPVWQLLLGLAWRIGGILGLEAVGIATAACTLVGVAILAQRQGARALPTIVALTLLVVLAPTAFVNRSASLAFVAFLLALDSIWRQLPMRAASGLLIAIAFVSSSLGIWLHASWAAWGPALGAISALRCTGASTGRRRPVMATLLFAASVLGTASGPSGWRVWKHGHDVATDVLGINTEWTSPMRAGAAWIALWMLSLVVLVWCIRGMRVSTTGPRTWRVHAVLASTLSLSSVVVGVRFLILSLICLAPLVAVQVQESAHGFAQRWHILGERITAPYWRRIAVALIALLAPIASFNAAHAYPTLRDPAVASLPANCNLFADDAAAVLLMRPDIRVWFDTRLDYWGRHRTEDFLRRASGTVPLPEGTTCVLLRADRRWSPLAHKLNRSEHWSRVPTPGSMVWTRLP